MKFLQLNIYKGRCLKELIAYINKEQFDLLHLQEVTSGVLSFADDTFETLKRATGLHGTLVMDSKVDQQANSYTHPT